MSALNSIKRKHRTGTKLLLVTVLGVRRSYQSCKEGIPFDRVQTLEPGRCQFYRWVQQYGRDG